MRWEIHIRTVKYRTTQLIHENGSLFVTIFENNIVHVAQKPGIESVAIEEGFIPKAATPNVTCKDTSDAKGTAAEAGVSDAAVKAVIRARDITVNVKDNEKLDIYYKGKLVLSDYEKARKKSEKNPYEDLAIAELEGHTVGKDEEKTDSVTIIKKLGKDDAIYGLGDKPGCLNKRGYSYVNWNTDDPAPHVDSFKSLYKSIPFFIVLGDAYCYGIFADNTYKTTFDFGYENTDYYFIEHEKGELDYYFMPGNDMAEVVGLYTSLTGTTPLYQRWIYGSHQSRWGYYTQDEVLDIADKFRELDIPCDTMHFDIDYMDGYRVFTWNEKDYGDPAGTIQELADDGFKAVCIIDPGVKLDPGYEKYDEGIAGDYFAKTPEGEVYVNAVWPGDSVYPDFGQPKVRKWWAENQKFLTDIGVAGVWNDMNEPASFHGELPSDVVFTDEDQKSTHAAMHNVYGHLMSKATYEGLKEQTGKRPFVITRACYAGSQKYTTVWTGDNQSLWSHLQMAVPQLCNLGLSGLAFAGTDVGGFGADCTAELLCRWVQVGAFSPLFRNHSSNGSIYQEPWQFGEKTVNIYRKFVELRYRLLPYLYDLFAECEKTGLPIMRPLVLHYEKDENTWNLNDEFLVGEHLLVAPVLEQGQTKKMVYLPEGIWYDFNTGKRYEGKQYYLVDAPLDTCPMFAKAGSMIPTYEVMQYVGEKPYDTLNMLVFPGEGTYVHYQDNGSDFAYQGGAYNQYAFTQQENGEVTMKRMKEGYERPYKKIEYIFVGK